VINPMQKRALILLSGILVLGGLAVAWWLRSSPTKPGPTLLAQPKSPVTHPQTIAVPPPTPTAPNNVVTSTPAATAAAVSSAPTPPAIASTSNSGGLPATPSGASTMSPIAEPTPATAASDDPMKAQILGTQRMIQAHASLRVPEVANPDSATNRRILETMVAKALSQIDAPPPTAAVRH
jgi:hypothetical protein